MTAKAEAAALDPGTTANDLVRLDGSAARARRDMAAVLEAKPSKQSEMTIASYAARHAAQKVMQR